MSEKIRKPNSRYSEKVEAGFKKLEADLNALKGEIEILEDEIKNKSTVPKNEDEKSVSLSVSEVLLRKAALTKKKYALKKLQTAFNRQANRVENVSKRVIGAYKKRLTAVNYTMVLAREAVKQKETLQSKVEEVMNAQKDKQNHTTLQTFALNNGVKFRSALDKIVKESLSIDERKLLNASSKVKTEIYRNIRGSFGWTNKAVGRPQF